MDAAYKELAAATVQAAAEDLESAYKKIKKREGLERAKKLEQHLASHRYSLDVGQDERLAVTFFEEENQQRELYYGLIGIPPDTVPKKIRIMRDYVLANLKNHIKAVSSHKGKASKRAKDALI